MGTYSGGSGTALAPYQIGTKADLIELYGTSADWGSYFLQTADIDLTGETTWTPIGNATTKFTGEYDGGFYEISNLTADLSTAQAGFFGNSSGVIKNVVLDNIYFTSTANNYHGILMGFLSNPGYVYRCGVLNSTMEQDSVSYSSYLTCFIGRTDTTATNSIEECFVKDTKLLLTNHSASGSYGSLFVSSNYNVSTVKNCYVVGTLEKNEDNGFNYLGGVFGTRSYDVEYCWSAISFTGTRAISSGAYVSGTTASSLTGCFYDSTLADGVTESNATAKTTTQMQTESTFTDYDFDNVWEMGDSDYPELRWYNESKYSGGYGTKNSPYKISTKADLITLSEYSDDWDKYFIQTDDIDLTGETSWTPIGNNSIKFTGEYDGDYYEISNLTYVTSADVYGFFGYSQGTIKNIKLVNHTMTSNRSDVGILVGKTSTGNDIQDCAVVDSTLTLSGTYNDGDNALFVGEAVSGKFTRCAVINSSLILQSSSNVFYKAGMFGGLIYGGCEVTDCYTNGTLTVNTHLFQQRAGFVGSTVSPVADFITTSYANVTRDGSRELDSEDSGFVEEVNSEITDCFFNSTTWGSTSSGSGTAKTTTEMKAESTFTNFDFDDVWTMGDSGYPELQWYAGGGGGGGIPKQNKFGKPMFNSPNFNKIIF